MEMKYFSSEREISYGLEFCKEVLEVITMSLKLQKHRIEDY